MEEERDDTMMMFNFKMRTPCLELGCLEALKLVACNEPLLKLNKDRLHWKREHEKIELKRVNA